MTRAHSPRDRVNAPARSVGGSAYRVVVLGVIVGIFVAAVTAVSWYRDDVSALRAQEAAAAASIVEGVRSRMVDIGEFVESEAVVYASDALPSQAALNDQFALPDVLGREPGVIGEFFVDRVPSRELDDFVVRQRTDVDADFAVFPPGDRDEYWVVARAVPSSLSSMLGVDGSAVSVAARALRASRDSGQPTASRTIPLSVQGLSDALGTKAIPRAIVVVTPVYETGTVPPTIAERRAELEGWAGVVVLGDLFARDLQRPTERTLGLTVFDGGPEDRTTSFLGVAPDSLLDPATRPAGEVRTATVDALGLRVSVRITPLTAQPEPSATAPIVVFVGGLLLSLLAGCLAFVLVRSRRQALHLAGDALAELRVSEDEVRKTEARFTSLVRRSSDIIAIVDRSARIHFVTPSVQRLLGVPPEAIEGTTLYDYVVPDERRRLDELVQRLDHADELATPSELALVRPDGGLRWLEVRVSNLLDDPNVGGIVLNGRDVTDRRAFQDLLTYEATHDRLTDLPNRARFLQMLAVAEERARRDGRGLAVLFIDIDHFKVVNDSLGHDVGDALLVAVGRRLVGAVRATDPVARLGGDEFVVLCENTDLAGATIVARHVITACAAPYEVAGRELRVTASIGIALAEARAESAESILRNADIAMYEAKAAGRACLRVFDDSARADIVRRLDTEQALRKALERGELRLFIQPVVRLSDGGVVGGEALLRWEHPERGLLLPGEFLAVAEESDLAIEIGDWVLHQAFAFLGDHATRLAVDRDFRLGVNLSNRHLGHSHLPARLAELAGDHRVDAGMVSIEITESAAMADPGHVRKVLVAIRDQGFSLALDDFGTGYSSLSHVKRLPIDTLKVDRAFVDGVTGDRDDRAIVAAAVGLGEALELQIVAEGVETRAQADELVALGCRLGQGFLYSPAVPTEEFLALCGVVVRPG